MIKSSSKQNKYSWIEILLVLSICLMPYTALKFIGPVGPSELLILMIFVWIFFKNGGRFSLPRRVSYATKTLGIYIVLCIFGLCWNLVSYLITGKLSAGAESIAFDFFSYCFNFLALYVIEILLTNKETGIEAESILRKVVNFNCVVMPALFAVSRVRQRILGMQLLYAGIYFTPFANNLHHTSMYLLPLVFLSLYFAARSSSFIKKIIYSVAALAFAYFSLQTGSSKAVLGVIAGAAAAVFYLLTSKKGKINNKTTLLMIIAVFGAILFIIIKYKAVFQFLVDYFVDIDGGGSRQNIWSNALKVWTKSPIIGFGPGSHTELYGIDHGADAHNTFLTVLLQTGLIGFVIYLSMWFKTIKLAFRNGYILAMYMTILVYSTGGDTLRRIPIWVFYVLGYYVLKKEKNQRTGELYTSN